MEEIFRKMKVICPRCKSSEYCKFRFLNNKRRCKKLQPRYICRRCNKYFTLGGKLYNSSSHWPSKSPILPNSCQSNFDAASPLYIMSSLDQYGAGYSSNGLRIQPSDSCRIVRTDMPGTHFLGGNLSSCSLVNPCSNINSGSNGSLGMWLPHNGRSSDIYGTPCFPPYDRQSGAQLVPFTFLENFSEDVMAPNLGFSHCVNDIPPLNIVEPMESLEVCQEMDSEYGLLMSEYIAEKDANGTSVGGGEEQREEHIAEEPQEEHIAEHSSTNLLGGEEMDNIFSAGSYDLDEEIDWLMDFIPKKLEDSDRCRQLELFDSKFLEIPTNPAFDVHYIDAFEGDCNVDEFDNMWMF